MIANGGITPDDVAGYDRLIDRRLVHKCANAEVFITDVRKVGSSWQCWAQISAGHSRVVSADGRLPLVLDFELIRQAAIAIAHLGYGVPLHESFIIDEVFIRRQNYEYDTMVLSAPVDLTLLARERSVVVRHGRVAVMELEMDFVDANDRVVAVGGGTFRCLTPAQYRAVRRNSYRISTDFASSSVSRVMDLVVTGSSMSAQLGVDYRDSFLFDHPTDHLPGLLFVDVATELFKLRDATLTVASLHLTSLAFTELGVPVTIHATVASDGHMDLEFHQESKTVALCVIATAAVASEPAVVHAASQSQMSIVA
jgi:hypothetical protein